MLLDEFDNNPSFCGANKMVTAAFNKESISLQLATDRGSQPLVDDHIIGGGWKLRPVHNLTVSVRLPFLSVMSLIVISFIRYH